MQNACVVTTSFAKAVLYVMIKVWLILKCDIKDTEQNVQLCTGFYFFISSLLGEKGTSKHKDNKSVPQNQPYTLLPKATFAMQSRSHLYEQVPMYFLNCMFF